MSNELLDIYSQTGSVTKPPYNPEAEDNNGKTQITFEEVKKLYEHYNGYFGQEKSPDGGQWKPETDGQCYKVLCEINKNPELMEVFDYLNKNNMDIETAHERLEALRKMQGNIPLNQDRKWMEEGGSELSELAEKLDQLKDLKWLFPDDGVILNKTLKELNLV